MFLTKGLQSLYSATIDRSRFRETATRISVFVIPLFFLGQKQFWPGLYVVALGTLVRGWAAGHLRKDQQMALGGPYLLVRHPLYLGSCLLAAGLILTLHHWFVTVTIGLLTTLQYFHTIRHEEQNLRQRFGQPYEEYSQRVAPVWPTFSSLRYFLGALVRPSGFSKFSFRQYLKNKEFECLAGVAALVIVLLVFSR